jgi:tetratricopeptide (TPR) repeat protein
VEGGDRDRARDEFHRITAADDVTSARIHLALKLLARIDRGASIRYCETSSLDDTNRLDGAIRFLSASGLHRKAVGLIRGNQVIGTFPVDSRILAFRALLRAGRRDLAVFDFILPAILDRSSKRAAVRAAGAAIVASPVFPRQTIPHIRSMLEYEDLDEEARGELIAALWRGLFLIEKSGEGEGILDSFLMAGREKEAFEAAAFLLHWYAGKGEAGACIAAVERFASRFPEAPARKGLVRALFGKIYKLGKQEELVGFVERMASKFPADPQWVTLYARALANGNSPAEAVRVLGQFLKNRSGETAMAELQAMGVIRLMARISCLEPGLREAFLDRAVIPGLKETGGRRPWTEGELLCLRSAEEDRYILRLKEMIRKEPGNPVHPRRLLAALLEGDRLEEAYDHAGKIMAGDGEDYRLAFTLSLLAGRLGRDGDAARWRERAFTTLERFPEFVESRSPFMPEDWAVEAAGRIAAKAEGFERFRALDRVARYRSSGGDLAGAADAWLDLLSESSGRTRYSAFQSLKHLCSDGKALDHLKKKLEAPSKWAGDDVLFHLIRFHLASAANESGPARKHLDRARSAGTRWEDYFSAWALVDALSREGRWEDVENLVLEAASRFGRQERQSLLRFACQFAHGSGTEPMTIRLSRRLLSEPNPHEDEDRFRLIVALVAQGRNFAAEEEARSFEVFTHFAWSSWESVIRGRWGQGRPRLAVDLALEAFELALECAPDRTMLHRTHDLVLGIHNDHIKHRPLHGTIRARLQFALQSAARSHFSGESVPRFWDRDETLFRAVGLENFPERLAREAASSGDPARAFRSAKYFELRGKPAKARTLLRHCLSRGAHDPRILARLYDLSAFGEEPQWHEAMRCLDSLFALGAIGEGAYLLGRSRCMYLMKDLTGGRKSGRAFMALPGSTRDGHALNELTRISKEAGDHGFTAEILETMIRNKKEAGPFQSWEVQQLYERLAAAYEIGGKLGKAEETCLRALSLVPRNRWPHPSLQDKLLKLWLGDLFGLLDGGDRAVLARLDSVVTRHEEEVRTSGLEKPQLRLALARAYERARNPKKRLQQLRIASEHLPEDHELKRDLSRALLNQERFEEAVVVLRAWSKSDPQNLEVWEQLGNTYMNMGRRELAEMAWSSLAEARPREAAGHRAYARILSRRGDAEDAAVALRKAVRNRPTRYEIARELSACYRKLDQWVRIPPLWTEGERACREAMERFPDDPDPWLNLARFLHEQKRIGEEKSLLKKILERSWPRFQRETHSEARNMQGNLK